MENKDIGLLKYCFSTAGQKKQKEAAAYLHKAAECLRKAGAISVTEENGKGCVIFQIKSGKNWENRDCIRYNISILSGARQISLKQERLWNEKVIASRLMCWYAGKRNEILPKGIRYYKEPVSMECRISLRGDWEKELIHKIGEMNRIIMEDYEIFDALNKGEIPETVEQQVRQEYKEYEREMNHGINIRENDTGFQ